MKRIHIFYMLYIIGILSMLSGGSLFIILQTHKTPSIVLEARALLEKDISDPDTLYIYQGSIDGTVLIVLFTAKSYDDELLDECIYVYHYAGTAAGNGTYYDQSDAQFNQLYAVMLANEPLEPYVLNESWSPTEVVSSISFFSGFIVIILSTILIKKEKTKVSDLSRLNPQENADENH